MHVMAGLDNNTGKCTSKWRACHPGSVQIFQMISGSWF